MKKLFIFICIFWLFACESSINQESITSDEVATEVYEDDEPFENPQPREPDERTYYSTDHVLEDGKIKYNFKEIEGADIESFEFLTGSYSRDNKNVYFQEERLRISDGISDRWDYRRKKNIEILKWDYSKDQKYIYYKEYGFIKHENKKINFLEQNWTEKISEYDFPIFLKVWEQIYLEDDLQDHIDAKSFKNRSLAYFQDDKWIYYKNTLLPVFPEKTIIIDRHFIKDDRFVFLYGKYHPELDAQTFKKINIPENHMYFIELYQDKSWFYSFWMMWHNFYKIKNNVSENSMKKCLADETLCENILGY